MNRPFALAALLLAALATDAAAQSLAVSRSVTSLEQRTGRLGARMLVEGPRGGTFIWDSAACTPDDVLVFAGASDPTGASGCWERELAPDAPVTPEMAGAVPDDATSDQAPLAAALAVAASSGRAVRLGGTYLVSDTLLVGADLDGRGGTLRATADAEAVLTVRADGVTISGLTVDGGARVPRPVRVVGATGTRLLGVTVRDFQDYADASYAGFVAGIFVVDGATDTLVRDCRVSGGKSENSEVTRAIYAGDAALPAWAPIDGLLVENCVFEDLQSSTADPGADSDAIQIQQDSTANVVLRGSVFRDVYKRAIKVQAPGVDVIDCRGEWTAAAGRISAAVAVYGSDVTVRNSTWNLYRATYGIVVGAAGQAIEDVDIVDNRITFAGYDSGFGQDAIRAADATAYTGLRVVNNRLGTGRYGIWVKDATGGEIAGNEISSFVTSLQLGTSSVPLSGFDVWGNEVDDGDGGLIGVTYLTGGRFANNTIRGGYPLLTATNASLIDNVFAPSAADPYGALVSCVSCRIVGNHIQGDESQPTPGKNGTGLRLYSGSTANTIIGNQFADWDTGLWVETGSGTTVGANLYHDCDTNYTDGATGTLQLVTDDQGVLVSSNIAFDLPSIAANSQGTINVTVSGAVAPNAVVASPLSPLPAGLIYQGAYAVGADTVRVVFYNATGSAIDDVNRAWRFVLER